MSRSPVGVRKRWAERSEGNGHRVVVLDEGRLVNLTAAEERPWAWWTCPSPTRRWATTGGSRSAS